MNLIEAEQLAKKLMREHGIWKLGWRLVWAKKATSVFGRTRFTDFTISLSKPLVELNGEDQVKDVILHEIAHALAPRKAHHNWQWKMIAKSIGARPEPYYGPEVLQPARRYIGVCQTCGRTVHRSTIKKLYCRMCNFKAGRTFAQTFLFQWTLNPAALASTPETCSNQRRPYPLTQKHMATKITFTLRAEAEGATPVEVTGNSVLEVVKKYRENKIVRAPLKKKKNSA